MCGPLPFAVGCVLHLASLSHCDIYKEFDFISLACVPSTALNQKEALLALLLCLHSPLSAPCPLRSDSRKNSIRRARSCLWGPRSNNAQKQFARGTHSHSFCLFEPFLVHVFCSFSHSFHNYAHFQFLIYNFLICYRVSRYLILSR